MTRLRPYLNGDSPALADLWNRGLPDKGVVRPLNPHEFDALVIGTLPFEREGLIVALREGRIVAFIHAGFGPVDPAGSTHRLDYGMGTIAMLVTEPGLDDAELELQLISAAERHLRSRGASVFYAGGQYPLNPFYWGLYGGGECSGILGVHQSFHRAVRRCGYEPAAESLILEADLSGPEPRDPQWTILRRQVRLDTDDEALPKGWWHALAVGLFHPTVFKLVDRSGDRTIATATTWEIAGGFGVGDGRPRIGLIDLEVAADQRRKGYGRLLVAEIFRHARRQDLEVVNVHTSVENTAARALYESLGFVVSDTTTLYRLPAALGERSGPSVVP